MYKRDNLNDIQALLGMVRALGVTCDLDKLLHMVVNYSMELLDAERATLYLYDKDTRELFTRIAEGTGEFRISIETGLAGAAARSLKVINIPDAYQDENFNRTHDEQTGYRTRSILACPLLDYDGQLVGVLQMLNKRAGPFDDDDITLAEALSAQAGVALQRARLIDQFLEKQRMENAMRIAHEIQKKLLPASAPKWEGFDIACWHRPCDATGGDYCDFLTIDDHRLMVSLGDVTGHGIGPALISCATRAMMRVLTSVNDDLEYVIQHVNRLMEMDLPDNRFVTAFMGVLDSRSGDLSYCSAGQGPLLWYSVSENKTKILSADGIPLGIIEEIGSMPAKRISFDAGDIFALLTDGFYEWARSDGEMFGIERVVDVITDKRDGSAEDILCAIRKATEAFADLQQNDDLTAIIIKKLETAR
ncbi:MAG: SpoIIE family protein phosphatase [Planctomycetes bacterium]|nr:SpoIIE family protein phosphatase [Planctomycetota bacterium]